MNKEQPKAKYYKCGYCKSLAFGFVDKCLFCDTPLTQENIINKEEFEMAARFGNYLLSKERRELYAKTEVEGFSLEERLSQVNHADVENFMDLIFEYKLQN
jgi:hypothetical protein